VQVPLGDRAEWHLHPYPPAAGTLIEMSRSRNRCDAPDSNAWCLFTTPSDGSPLMNNKTSRTSPSLRPPSAGQLSPQDLAGVVEALTGQRVLRARMWVSPATSSPKKHRLDGRGDWAARALCSSTGALGFP